MFFFSMPKVLVASGFGTVGAVAVAQMLWHDLPIFVLLGLAALTLFSNMGVGLWVRYKEIKSRTDCEDVRLKLAAATRDVQFMVEDRDRWRSLYQMAAGIDRGSSRQRSEPG